MTWMIGIDEAGYGPNLGPLAVAATVWNVGEAVVEGPRSGEALAARSVDLLAAPAACVDLYERLSSYVCATPEDDRLAIGDSKALYKPGGGLRLLERGVLTALGTVGGDAPARWQDLFAASDVSLPWYVDYDCTLPIDANAQEIADITDRFTSACVFAGVELMDVQTRLVFPRKFNDLTKRYGTKGAALSHISIGLLRKVLTFLPDLRALTSDPCVVTCDKHGGRNRYAALLQHHFPEHWIDTVQESRAASSYTWGPSESGVTITFRTRGEEELPAALASMTAKYYRELAMRAFNAFWTREVPGLRPTAGYPADAKRFKTAIAERQRELGIDDRDVWRNR